MTKCRAGFATATCNKLCEHNLLMACLQTCYMYKLLVFYVCSRLTRQLKSVLPINNYFLLTKRF